MAATITVEEFEALYRRTAPELFAYVRRRGAADPEDLVAEVFVTAWRRRSDLPDPALHRAWLYGTARRLLLAESRSRGREHAVVELLAAHADASTDDHNQRTANTITAALARLSPDDRDLILLIEWERLTPAEVAVALGIRPGTARVRLHRARQTLASDPQMRALISTRTECTTGVPQPS